MDGEVYMCGNGEQGQLGLGISTLKEYKPLKVKLSDENGKTAMLSPKFKQVVCGAFHSGFLTENGVIYVTGDNSEG
jgi:alpha-tubulin suppressor-like RCC1 family protein